MTPQQLALMRKRAELQQRLSRVTNENEPQPEVIPQNTPAAPPAQNIPANVEVQPQPPIVQNQPTMLTRDQLRKDRILDILISIFLFALLGLLIRKMSDESNLDEL